MENPSAATPAPGTLAAAAIDAAIDAARDALAATDLAAAIAFSVVRTSEDVPAANVLATARIVIYRPRHPSRRERR